MQKQIEIFFPITSLESRILSLRYWDGAGSDMFVELNGTRLGTIRYEGTSSPKSFTSELILSPGIYSLSIILEYTPQLSQYASLDYLKISHIGV
jgi:hypothetical protein